VWPLNNAAMTVVNMMNPSHVETVFIGGKVKKWRGNLVGVDVPGVLRLVEEAATAFCAGPTMQKTCSADASVDGRNPRRNDNDRAEQQ